MSFEKAIIGKYNNIENLWGKEEPLDIINDLATKVNDNFNKALQLGIEVTPNSKIEFPDELLKAELDEVFYKAKGSKPTPPDRWVTIDGRHVLINGQTGEIKGGAVYGDGGKKITPGGKVSGSAGDGKSENTTSEKGKEEEPKKEEKSDPKKRKLGETVFIDDGSRVNPKPCKGKIIKLPSKNDESYQVEFKGEYGKTSRYFHPGNIHDSKNDVLEHSKKVDENQKRKDKEAKESKLEKLNPSFKEIRELGSDKTMKIDFGHAISSEVANQLEEGMKKFDDKHRFFSNVNAGTMTIISEVRGSKKQEEHLKSLQQTVKDVIAGKKSEKPELPKTPEKLKDKKRRFKKPSDTDNPSKQYNVVYNNIIDDNKTFKGWYAQIHNEAIDQGWKEGISERKFSDFLSNYGVKDTVDMYFDSPKDVLKEYTELYGEKPEGTKKEESKDKDILDAVKPKKKK